MADGALTPQGWMWRENTSPLRKAMNWLRGANNTGRTDNRTGKPVNDIHFTGGEPRIQYPKLAMPYWAMYETMYMCATARTIVNHLIEETFRNRGEWKEKYAVKCLVCKLEMEVAPKDGLCQRRSCRSTVMVSRDIPGVFGYSPDEDELAFINNGRKDSEWKGFRKVNRANMSIWDVMRALAFDLCTVDDMYLICVKTYGYRKNAEGNIEVFAQPQEIVRGNPQVMRIVADDYGNRGGIYYQCPLHRSKMYVRPGAGMRSYAQPTTYASAMGSYEGLNIPAEVLKGETCPVFDAGIGRNCGLPLKNIHYVATDVGGSAPKQYYFEDECLHVSYYSPSVIYGIAPVVTLWREMRSLIKMMEYVQTYFEKRRIPRGIVAVNTPRKEAITRLKESINREADDNQHDLPFIAVEGSNQRGWIEFIPFADKLNEMDLQALRDECRMTIGGFYGVSPIMQGDTAQGGGLNNEGLQLTVMNRGVEAFQHVWNEKVFPWVAEQFGIKDHEFILHPSEEKDRAHTIQLELMRQQVSDGKMARGLRFIGLDEDGEYVHEDKPDPMHPSQAIFSKGGMNTGGMPPQMQGQMPGGVQPGAPQPKPMGQGAQNSMQSQMEEPDGSPMKRKGNGEQEDIL